MNRSACLPFHILFSLLRPLAAFQPLLTFQGTNEEKNPKKKRVMRIRKSKDCQNNSEKKNALCTYVKAKIATTTLKQKIKSKNIALS